MRLARAEGALERALRPGLDFGGSGFRQAPSLRKGFALPTAAALLARQGSLAAALDAKGAELPLEARLAHAMGSLQSEVQERLGTVRAWCEHAEGEVMWVPEGWWHETCALGAYSIAIGALTTLDPIGGEDRAARECAPGEYTTRELAYCQADPVRCPSLA